MVGELGHIMLHQFKARCQGRDRANRYLLRLPKLRRIWPGHCLCNNVQLFINIFQKGIHGIPIFHQALDPGFILIVEVR